MTGNGSARFGGRFSRWLLRTVLWTLTHTLYRLRICGREYLPEKGGALIVCNHLSHVDALLLLASSKREIRFMMYKGIYQKPLIKPLADIMRVIPISSELRPREMIQSLRVPVRPSKMAKSSASLPRAKSPVSVRCSRSVGASSAL